MLVLKQKILLFFRFFAKKYGFTNSFFTFGRLQKCKNYKSCWNTIYRIGQNLNLLKFGLANALR